MFTDFVGNKGYEVLCCTLTCEATAGYRGNKLK